MVGDSPKITKVVSDLSAAGAPVYSRIGYLLVSDVGTECMDALRRGLAAEPEHNPSTLRHLHVDLDLSK